MLTETPHCDYFQAGRCRSCTLIETPYAEQLRGKSRRCRELLGQCVPDTAWLPPVRGDGSSGEHTSPSPLTAGGATSPVRDFRNKAKLVVGGVAGSVTLGILDGRSTGVDLRDCLIHEAPIRAVIPRIAEFLDEIGIEPYDVPLRRGEAKYAHVQASPNGKLMLRFVVRTQHGLAQIRKHLSRLRELVPEATVISVNLLPEHKAVLEGAREEPLLGETLRLDLEVPLHLRPQSFFQTNTAVARALYAQAADWVSALDPASLWDLYCGVGGFALHCAGVTEPHRVPAVRGAATAASHGSRRGVTTGRRVFGVELSESAIESAKRSARETGIDAHFEARDATEFALAAQSHELPELVIVNPPRRGIGPKLAEWLESAAIPNVIYSSCNPQSLARDLAAMPSLRVRAARVFDMFPHTSHLEVAVLLERAVER